MYNPNVSIITPTYNHERFIGPCIESVLAQSYPHWEMIIVDDGSTDGTWAIVQRYAVRDRRIKAFQQANKGIWSLAETYNFALEQSCGELITVLEGDDTWIQDKLEIQVPFHLSQKCALSFGRVKLINEVGETIGAVCFPDTAKQPFLTTESNEQLFLRHLRGEYGLPALTVMLTRQCLVSIGGFQQTAYLPLVDYPTWLSIGLRSGGYGFLNTELGAWRQFSRQTTWRLAHAVAHGMYRFAQEFTHAHTVSLPEGTAARLLNSNRRAYLADASYRSALIAFETGKPRTAIRRSLEIMQLGQPRLFAQCVAVIIYKMLRQSLPQPR